MSTKFKRLPNAFKSKRKNKRFTPPDPPAPEQFNVVDTELRRLERLLDDPKAAKRVMSLAKRFPVGTIPELVTYDWLQQQNYPFEYQVSLFGGRRAPAGVGLVPDFVVSFDASRAIVWQVQGEYWHTRGEKEHTDVSAHVRMLGAIYNGAKIWKVVEIWEDDIYSKRPWVFYSALQGVGLRG